MTIYVIQHILTHELLEAFADKGLAEKWHEAVNYSILKEVELEQPTMETMHNETIVL